MTLHIGLYIVNIKAPYYYSQRRQLPFLCNAKEYFHIQPMLNSKQVKETSLWGSTLQKTQLLVVQVGEDKKSKKNPSEKSPVLFYNFPRCRDQHVPFSHSRCAKQSLFISDSLANCKKYSTERAKLPYIQLYVFPACKSDTTKEKRQIAAAKYCLTAHFTPVTIYL